MYVLSRFSFERKCFSKKQNKYCLFLTITNTIVACNELVDVVVN